MQRTPIHMHECRHAIATYLICQVEEEALCSVLLLVLLDDRHSPCAEQMRRIRTPVIGLRACSLSIALPLALRHLVPEQLRATARDAAVLRVLLVEVKAVAVKVVRPVVLRPFVVATIAISDGGDSDVQDDVGDMLCGVQQQ